MTHEFKKYDKLSHLLEEKERLGGYLLIEFKNKE